MRTKIFIIEYNFYCTRRCKVKKIETQQVEVELLTMQTSMYYDVHESSCRGESSRGESSSNDNEDECNVAKRCCAGAVGCCGYLTPRSTPRVQDIQDLINRHSK